MQRTALCGLITTLLLGCAQVPNQTPDTTAIKTIANPLDLNYRFMLSGRFREAADATVVRYQDKYLMFASKSGGYFVSDDLVDWQVVETDQYNVEDYAPSAVVIDDTVYLLASSHKKTSLYRSDDPLSGNWEVEVQEMQYGIWDPAFFMDDDKRLYLYWGCSNSHPLWGVELDYRDQFRFIDRRKGLVETHQALHGWEVSGDDHTNDERKAWIEGAWVTKHDGRYYLSYAGPGTEYNTYNDGMYVSDSPLGPFTLAEHNPFAYKPAGFVAGAGHGNTFEDKYGNYWHMGTASASTVNTFARRLGIYPTFFDEDGIAHAVTKYGDYPMIVPDHKITDFDQLFPGWMLLSYDKPVTVSSSQADYPASQMVDEQIKTYWAAETGGEHEWAMVDLQGDYQVHAIQINFSEHNAKAKGRQPDLRHRYVVESSLDGQQWQTVMDRADAEHDNPHAYLQLPQAQPARYVRLRNLEVASGELALSGFRVFGLGDGAKPAEVTGLRAERQADPRRVALSWMAVPEATGYTVSFGTHPGKLYSHHTVYGNNQVDINALHGERDYYFGIEAFNENGITPSPSVVKVTAPR
ncbi:family 43 glycosylhydrolase [Ferrimonas pelagia]|uniref:Family 43 glycosylhydrolase n=1 Tax=Ferrimonas pelagia TaxID=1177826 RepID=A0ABP9FHB5_9GAMM